MKFQTKWIWFTFSGWILGIIAALIITPLINSLTGKYLQQSPLPISISAIIGILQALLLKKYYRNNFTWLWIYLFAFVICFTSIESISDLIGIKPEFYMPFGTLVSALLTGYLQARLFLRIKGKEFATWILQCTFAWSITVAFVFIVPLFGFHLARQVSMIINMAIILFGGLILGYLTKNFKIR